jgi:hypothetical protein
MTVVLRFCCRVSFGVMCKESIPFVIIITLSAQIPVLLILRRNILDELCPKCSVVSLKKKNCSVVLVILISWDKILIPWGKCHAQKPEHGFEYNAFSSYSLFFSFQEGSYFFFS